MSQNPLRLNLGCGKDLRSGYTNVDLYPPYDRRVDLSSFPWPWLDSTVDEVVMLDFLEHFPYRDTGKILQECWRILKTDGILEVQVPDFVSCARVLTGDSHYQCNRCAQFLDLLNVSCSRCGQHVTEIEDAAVARLYGGQDRPGNWHFTTFTEGTLTRHLETNGFRDLRLLELNENGETYSQNWNMKIRAKKGADLWSE